MVLSSSFSFAFSHRRNKNSNKDDVNAEKDSRKISIDHTISTRDDSQQMNCMADIYQSSFDLVVDHPAPGRSDALIGDAHPNGGYGYRGERMTHSHSAPSFSAQDTAAGRCSCADCYAEVTRRQQPLSSSYTGPSPSQQLGYVSSSIQPPPPPTFNSPPMVCQPPTYYNNTPPSDNGSVDRTLQARIEAVKIQEQLLGLAHPDVIFALAGIAKLYEKRGDHAQAANIMKESQMRSIMAKSAHQGNLNRSSHEVEDVPIEISFPR